MIEKELCRYAEKLANFIRRKDFAPVAKWLDIERNIGQLRKVDGIGPKIIDYLKILAGDQAIAIDRHLFAFLELAGIPLCSYQEASLIYSKAAELLNISQYELDKKIWTYMSKA